MIVPLVESESATPQVEKRRSTRLVPSAGTVYAEMVGPDGKVQRTSVGDLSPSGAKLIGEFSVEVGDALRVGLHLDSKSAPYEVPAIVARVGSDAIGVRFSM